MGNVLVDAARARLALAFELYVAGVVFQRELPQRGIRTELLCLLDDPSQTATDVAQRAGRQPVDVFLVGDTELGVPLNRDSVGPIPRGARALFAGTGGCQKPGVLRAPAWIAPFTAAGAFSVRRSASLPASLTASSHTRECTPSTGFQWNFTKHDFPCSSTKRKVCTPKPSIIAKLRGMARSDMAHMTVCIDSGTIEMKSQNVSWAEEACGISLCGSGLTE